jgi:hypothetical protein
LQTALNAAPVAKRHPHAADRRRTDQRRAIELLARHLTDVASRYAEIFETLRAAAHTGDTELRELWEREEDERLEGARHWIARLRRKGPLRNGLTTTNAIDVMWWLMAPDHYHRLVKGRGWTNHKYRDWLATSMSRLLLADTRH